LSRLTFELFVRVNFVLCFTGQPYVLLFRKVRQSAF
jgi:hypothetical protein